MSFSATRINPIRVSIQPEQPIASEIRSQLNWTKAVVVVLLMALMGFLLFPPECALAEEPASGNESSDGTGIQVASWALTVPYVIGKGAFALGGAVVGGLGYVFSGGNFDTAKAVWTRSIYGTYLIRPSHLRGEEPVYFLGKADEGRAEVAPRPAQPTPGPAKPEKQ